MDTHSPPDGFLQIPISSMVKALMGKSMGCAGSSGAGGCFLLVVGEE